MRRCSPAHQASANSASLQVSDASFCTAQIFTERYDTCVGRPREFDADEVLEEAMKVFWQKGYDGASISDLTNAMGIQRPTLYSAFGSKEELFAAALERYQEGPSGYFDMAIAEPTSRGVAEALLRGAAELHTDPGSPPGCLTVQGSLVSAEGQGGPAGKLAAVRNDAELTIRRRLENAQADGDLPADADPAALAAYLRTVTYGMAVQAASGATRQQLRKTVDQALKAWPTA
jgi:AcrR family transcriptional regulator